MFSFISRGQPNLRRQEADFMGRSQGWLPFLLVYYGTASPYASYWSRGPSSLTPWLLKKAICHTVPPLTANWPKWLSIMQPHPLPVGGEGWGCMAGSPQPISSKGGEAAILSAPLCAGNHSLPFPSGGLHIQKDWWLPNYISFFPADIMDNAYFHNFCKI